MGAISRGKYASLLVIDQGSMEYKQGTERNKGKEGKKNSLGRTDYKSHTEPHSLGSRNDTPYTGQPQWASKEVGQHVMWLSRDRNLGLSPQSAVFFFFRIELRPRNNPVPPQWPL